MIFSLVNIMIYIIDIDIFVPTASFLRKVCHVLHARLMREFNKVFEFFEYNCTSLVKVGMLNHTYRQALQALGVGLSGLDDMRTPFCLAISIMIFGIHCTP